MALLVTFLVIAIFISFLCSILEAVLLSITPSYIEALKEEGKLGLQKRLQKLKDDIDKPLAAILSFNTIAHTAGAAGVGAQSAKVFGEAYLGATSAILTLLILIFSEIIPKTIGATYWRSLTGITARTLRILIWAMYPLVILAQGITKILSKDKKENTVSREEVSAMADLGQREGIFLESESRMIKSMVRFRQVLLEGIMTPRTVIVMVPETMTISELFNLPDFTKVSRIPVYGENRDDITGYVHKHDVLTAKANDEHNKKLEEIKRKILMVDKDRRVLELFERFVRTNEQIALATDKYGTVSGLVTLEDVMETVLGMEIMDEFDSVEDMRKLARDRWAKRALASGIINEHEGRKDAPAKYQDDTEEVAKYGITGGQAPAKDAPGSSDKDKS